MRFIAAAVAAICAVSVLDLRAQGNLIGLLETYRQGRHDEAIQKAAAVPDLGPLRLQFVQQTPVWITADPADAERRRAAAAGFIVELAAVRLESDWGRLSDLIEWTCAHVLRAGAPNARTVRVGVEAGGPPTAFEHSWHMATTALAGRARTRLWLLGPYARLPHQKPLKRAPQKDDPPSPQHLMHAIERFPDDPEFQLARVVAWTWGRDSEPMRNIRQDWRDNLNRWAPSRPPQLEAITAFEPLLGIPAVAAEAHIRTGMIHVSVSDHAAALRSFEAAQPLARTPPLTYLSHFLAGRSLEILQRQDEAIAQYERALQIVPDAESATVALASLRFLRGEAEPAIARINNTFAIPAPTTDPGRLIGYGSYLHWPEIKAAMRAELRGRD
jgi:tetratricopeptide (TPR) repeat protein